MALQRTRSRAVTTNIVPFPGGLEFRLEKSIEAFNNGTDDVALYDEFKFLSANGVSEAHFFLGCISEDGTNGQLVNIETALHHYDIAINEIGYVEAYLAAARLCLVGKPSQENIIRAFEYYKYVADNTSNAIACFRLGRMYHLGFGVDTDLVAAELLYKRAVEQGSLYGLLFSALLEFENGRYYKWFILRVRAIRLAVYLSVTNGRDFRLRAW